MAVGPGKTIKTYNDFSGGEVAPAAQGLTDAEFYDNAAARMVNCQPSRTGGLESRNGFRKIYELAEDVKYARVFPLGIEGFLDKCVVFTDTGDLIIVDQDSSLVPTDVGFNPAVANNPLNTWELSGPRPASTSFARNYGFNVQGGRNNTFANNTNYIPKPINSPEGVLDWQDYTVDDNTFFYAGSNVGASRLVLPLVSDRELYSNSPTPEVYSPFNTIALMSGAFYAGMKGNIFYDGLTDFSGEEITLGVLDSGRSSFDNINPLRYVGMIYKEVELPADGSDVFLEVVVGKTRGGLGSNGSGGADAIDRRSDNNWGAPRIDFSTTFNASPPPGEDNMSLDGGFFKCDDLVPFAEDDYTVTYRVPVDIESLAVTQSVSIAPGATVDCWVRVQNRGNRSNYPMQDEYWFANLLRNPAPQPTPFPGEVYDVVPYFSRAANYYDGSSGAVKPRFSAEVHVVSITVLVENAEGVAPVTILNNTDYVDEDIRDLQFDVPPEDNAQYFTTPRKVPKVLAYDTNSGVWSFTDIDLTDAPPEWLPSKFPTCVTFFQGRSWWGGVSDFGYRLWGSQPGDYLNFGVADPANPTAQDALVFDLATGGRILWLASRESLLVGTTLGEISLRVEGLISPVNLPTVGKQSSFGSSLVQPVEVGDIVYYVDATDGKLRGAKFAWEQQVWLSTLVSARFSHVVLKPRDLYFSINDESVTFVNQQGEIIKLLWIEGRLSMSRHTTSGSFVSFCQPLAVAKGGYAVVNRSGVLFLEREDSVLLDGSTDYFVTADDVAYTTFIVPENTIVDEDLTAVIDRDAYNIKLLEIDGEEVFGIENVPVNSTLTLGSSFNNVWEPLPPVISGSQGFSEKIPNQVVMRMYNSAIPYVNETPSRDQVAGVSSDGTVNNLTADVRVEVDTVETIPGLVRLSQPNPVPFNITAVFLDINEDQI